MSTRPLVIRILIRLLLGLNGYVLNVAGFIAAAVVAMMLAHNPGWIWPRGLITFMASVAVGMMGFLMVSAADVFTGVRFRGVPPNRIAMTASTELAFMTFAILTVSSLLGTLVSTQLRPISWEWPFFSLVSASGLAATFRFKRAGSEQRKLEVAQIPPNKHHG